MLVATDIAARGIDVANLTYVVHYQLPDQDEYYTHRSGRTARAGKEGRLKITKVSAIISVLKKSDFVILMLSYINALSIFSLLILTAF